MACHPGSEFHFGRSCNWEDAVGNREGLWELREVELELEHKMLQVRESLGGLEQAMCELGSTAMWT